MLNYQATLCFCNMTRNANLSISDPVSVSQEKVITISALAVKRICNRQLIILRLSDLSSGLQIRSSLT